MMDICCPFRTALFISIKLANYLVSFLLLNYISSTKLILTKIKFEINKKFRTRLKKYKV